jgi:hypothetical protein
MYDLIYDFISGTLINSSYTHQYLDELALTLTHISIWLIYFILIALLVHVFNSFRAMTRFW